MVSDDVKRAPSWHSYERVSQDRTGKQKSQEDQAAENTEMREEHGAAPGSVYRDTGSASKFARSARGNFDKLMADLRSGHFRRGDALQLWESSRGSRKQAEWATLLDELAARGVLIAVTSQDRVLDPTKARDRKSLDDDGTNSAYESNLLSERVRRGVRRSALAGRPHGRAKYGFKRIYDQDSGEYVRQEADPVTAEIVREIVGRVARSEPISAIADDLNARGVPAPDGSRWFRATVRKFAAHEGFIGKRRWQGELIDGDWPALVDVEVFWQAQAVLNAPGRKVTRPGKVKHMLTGITHCEEGCPLRMWTRDHGAFQMYSCRHTRAPKAAMDEVVRERVVQRMCREDVIDLFQHADDGAAAAARAEVLRLKSELEQWRQLADTGDVTAVSFARAESGLLAKIEQAEQAARSATVPAVLHDLVDPAGRTDVVGARFDAMPVAARRDVIKALMVVTLRRGVPYARVFDPGRVTVEWL